MHVLESTPGSKLQEGKRATLNELMLIHAGLQPRAMLELPESPDGHRSTAGDSQEATPVLSLVGCGCFWLMQAQGTPSCMMLAAYDAWTDLFTNHSCTQGQGNGA